jgi:uncharacterized protein YjbI with pentapeptide repeats
MRNLAEILESHKRWLAGEMPDGRAALNIAELRNANLSGADLRRANLIGADFTRADLRGVNLIDAYLFGADLSGAELSDTGITYLKGSNHSIIKLDNVVWIGCLKMSLDYWLANYQQIGRDNEYTEEQITEYGKLLESLK